MRTHAVTGGNRTRLHVEETGRSDGTPLLFIHGFSQCGASWRRQTHSSLADEFRVVTLDLRGHGRSDKPDDAYGDGRLWAEDIHAVIKQLGLAQPLLVGWSYGGFVICDYLRYYGDHDIGGINFVGAATKISQETAPDVLGAAFLVLLPGFFSTDAGEAVRTMREFVTICTPGAAVGDDLYTSLGYNVLVPPGVRQALLSRTIDNDDVLPGLSVPVLISQGEDDPIVHPQVARDLASMIPGARISMYAGAGHAPFLDDAERFNRELAEFARSAARAAVVT